MVKNPVNFPILFPVFLKIRSRIASKFIRKRYSLSIKKILQEYFSFTKKERVGSFVIITVTVLIWFLPGLLEIFYPGQKKIPQDSSWITAVKHLEKHSAKENEFSNENADPFESTSTPFSNPSRTALFYFDPNTLSIEGWKKLGLRDKTIQTIKNYLDKGGHFKTPDDLQKIYGLHIDEFHRIKSYVRIEQTTIDSKPHYYPSEKTSSYTKNYPSKETIEINTADTTALISLPGIGSKLAGRIVNFRDGLGGFYSVDQVKEIYGLPDSTFQKIRNRIVLKDVEVRKLNINTATKDELKTHPYIKWNLANAIVEFRTQHGNFSKPEDIQKIQLITPEIFLKVKPYLIVE